MLVVVGSYEQMLLGYNISQVQASTILFHKKFSFSNRKKADSSTTRHSQTIRIRVA